jgi:uncharacterized protein
MRQPKYRHLLRQPATLFLMPLDSRYDSQAAIQALGMAPHPEGGWYVETFRAPSAPGARSAVSAIYFLLQAGQRSRWHSVDASEIWLWHAGSSIRLRLSSNGRQTEAIVLGQGIAEGERPQVTVPAGVWQSAESTGAWSLVSCIVAPAFEFAGFTLAPLNWSPGPIGRRV